MKVTDEPPMFMVKGLNDEVAVKNSDYKYLIECAEIVESLKKRIKECETNSLKISMKTQWKEYANQIRLLPELKKILGEENEHAGI